MFGRYIEVLKHAMVGVPPAACEAIPPSLCLIRVCGQYRTFNAIAPTIVLQPHTGLFEGQVRNFDGLRFVQLAYPIEPNILNDSSGLLERAI